MDTTDSSAPAHPSTEEKILANLEERLAHELLDDDEKPTKPDDLEAHYSCLERLEDDLCHADLGIEERCELEDRVLRLRRRLAR